MKGDIDQGRIGRPPDNMKVLLSEGSHESEGIVIKKIEMRQYVERKDAHLGDYSLLTVMLETNKGTVEMKYDEGFRGQNALESAATNLMQYVGLASLINRALIELQQQ